MGDAHVHRATNADTWGRWLSTELGAPWTVTFSRARATPVQARRAHNGGELRLHHMFLEAPDDVREALGRWLRVGRRAQVASERLDDWIHSELARLPKPVRAVRLHPSGRTHDLGPLTAALLAGEFRGDFEGELAPPGVTWGRRTSSRSRRSLRLGSFEPATHLVRVHPVLDQAGVPEWFVNFVLKHELLHAVLPPYRTEAGRWVHHSPVFRRRERSWSEYLAALEWETQNLPRLIRSAREGTTLRVRADGFSVGQSTNGAAHQLSFQTTRSAGAT